MAKNIQKDALYKELDGIFDKMNQKMKNSPDFHRCQTIMKELKAGKLIQQNSSELMAFLIQDLLDLAQINSGKFRKNISCFDIRASVEKVMNIQKKTAEDKGLEFKSFFVNNSHMNSMICTDENRVMQVLLGL